MTTGPWGPILETTRKWKFTNFLQVNTICQDRTQCSTHCRLCSCGTVPVLCNCSCNLICSSELWRKASCLICMAVIYEFNMFIWILAQSFMPYLHGAGQSSSPHSQTDMQTMPTFCPGAQAPDFFFWCLCTLRHASKPHCQLSSMSWMSSQIFIFCHVNTSALIHFNHCGLYKFWNIPVRPCCQIVNNSMLWSVDWSSQST